MKGLYNTVREMLPELRDKVAEACVKEADQLLKIRGFNCTETEWQNISEYDDLHDMTFQMHYVKRDGHNIEIIEIYVYSRLDHNDETYMRYTRKENGHQVWSENNRRFNLAELPQYLPAVRKRYEDSLKPRSKYA